LDEGVKWPVPRFEYGARVLVVPCDLVQARVVDLHIIGMLSSIEYDVRWFHDGREVKVRVFEDELAPATDQPAPDGVIYKVKWP
jgi:hypothetical protein